MADILQPTSQAPLASGAESPPGSPSSGPAASTPAPGAASPGGSGAGVASSTPSPSPAGGSASPAPAGSGAGYVPVHEALRSYGYELPQGLEGHAALQHLVAQARQAQDQQHLIGYGREYVQHADAFQAFLKQQQEAQAKVQQASQEWWKAPEFDPTWLSKLYSDPTTGEIKALPGADPRLADKYRQWTDHKARFLDQMAQDPVKAIRPGIEQVARQVAQELIQQHLGGYQAQQSAQSFVQQHSGWLHARDQQGQLVVNPQTGRPQLSEWGQRFAGYVQEAEQLGVADMQGQQKYAMQGVQRDYALFKLSQQGTPGAAGTGTSPTPAPSAPTPNQAFLDRANPPTGGHGSVPVPVPSQGSQAQPEQPRRKLREVMLEAMKANGMQPSDELPLG